MVFLQNNFRSTPIGSSKNLKDPNLNDLKPEEPSLKEGPARYGGADREPGAVEGSLISSTLIRQEAGPFCGSFLHKVFAYVGLIQNLRNLKDQRVLLGLGIDA
jgi:hypothetical protein